MRKNVTIAALVALLLASVYTDITIRTGADGWCAWWRTNVKVCSLTIDVDQAVARTEISRVDYHERAPDRRTVNVRRA